MARALVVFFDPDGARFQRLLKAGFRHVFCVVDEGNYWVSFDAHLSGVAVDVLQASSFDLAGFYRDEGYIVVEVERTQRIRSPMAWATCVGLTKAVCGIRAPFAITPFQLYRHLTRDSRA